MGDSEARIHEPCALVLSLNEKSMESGATLAGMAADMNYVKRILDNGLSKKLEDVKTALHRAEEHTVQVKIDLDKKNADLAKQVAVMDADSWLVKLLTMGTKKAILVFLGFLLVSGLFGNSVWVAVRTYYKESPGEMKQVVQSTSVNSYHTHLLSDGNTLIHANSAEKRAFVIKKDGTWVPAPKYRIDLPEIN